MKGCLPVGGLVAAGLVVLGLSLRGNVECGPGGQCPGDPGPFFIVAAVVVLVLAVIVDRSPSRFDGREAIENASPPIVLIDGMDHHLFGSITELVGWVEAIDVRDGGYTVIDSRGRVIALSADSDTAPVHAEVTDQLAAARLEAHLRAWVDGNPTRWGLIDADVGLDPLLRAVWRVERPKRPFPK